MAEVVVLGAGLSGTIMAYELLPQLRSSDTLTVVGQDLRYHFLPSNPWVAIGLGGSRRAVARYDRGRRGAGHVMFRPGLRLLERLNLRKIKETV